jgi:aryl-alcohol dehydrogenase-like predicted oxidoreductase
MLIGLGCVNLGSASAGGRRADERLVRAAVDRGITRFDTADAYGSGNSEGVLGRALAPVRSSVEIATKAGYRFRSRSPVEQALRRVVRRVRPATPGPGPAALGGPAYSNQDFSPAYIRQALESSLRRLGTDHVDVFQLHGPHEVLPDLVPVLQSLVAAGKTRRIGIGAEHVEDAAAWLSVDGIDVVQVPFGVLDPEAAHDVLPLARQRGVEVWARGVLGGGLLAAATRGEPAATDEPKGPAILALRRLAEETGVGVVALAVGFVRAHQDVSTVLLGTSSLEHLERNLELMAAPPLSDDVVERLRTLVRTGDGDRDRDG